MIPQETEAPQILVNFLIRSGQCIRQCLARRSIFVADCDEIRSVILIHCAQKNHTLSKLSALRLVAPIFPRSYRIALHKDLTDTIRPYGRRKRLSRLGWRIEPYRRAGTCKSLNLSLFFLHRIEPYRSYRLATHDAIRFCLYGLVVSPPYRLPDTARTRQNAPYECVAGVLRRRRSQSKNHP